MQDYKTKFIEFAINRNVLRFGQFTLKSGRLSPYFFNAGLFNTGADLALLGKCYAEALTQSGIAFDVLFGPAYKGIPIATTTAVALATEHNRSVPYCFNRKEAKAHGEGGSLVGSELCYRYYLSLVLPPYFACLTYELGTCETHVQESLALCQFLVYHCLPSYQ